MIYFTIQYGFLYGCFIFFIIKIKNKEKLSKYMYAWQVSNIRLESIDECKIDFNYTSSYSSWQQILPT